MRMRAGIGAAVLALGVAGAALAAQKGDPLYVKAKNTRLMDSSATSANVVRVLQPGQVVTWLGADPKNKRWHLVEVDKTQGVIFQSNLATKPPNMELVATQGGVAQKNAADFANSAAAVKLLSDGAIQYGNKEGDLKTAVKELQALERIAEGVKADRLAKHAKQAGLFPVVGPSEKAPAKSKVAGGGAR